MKHTLIAFMLLFMGMTTAHAAKSSGPGPSPTMNPNVKQGLTGMLVQPQVAYTNDKLKVTLFSYLPQGEKCEVVFKHPGLQYAVKLLVDTSPYQVPNQYQPAFKTAGQYTIKAYTGTTGEHPCPQGKQVKIQVTIKSLKHYKESPVQTKPQPQYSPGPVKRKVQPTHTR